MFLSSRMKNEEAISQLNRINDLITSYEENKRKIIERRNANLNKKRFLEVYNKIVLVLNGNLGDLIREREILEAQLVKNQDNPPQT